MNKVRICLLMSGMPRVFLTGLDLLRRQLGTEMESEIHLFAHFWSPLAPQLEEDLRSQFTNLVIWQSEPRNFSDVTIERKHDETNPANFLSMLWGRQLLLEHLVQEQLLRDEQFDLFIHTRPDVALTDSLNLLDCVGLIKDGNRVLVPRSGHWRNGVNDQFAITNAFGIKVYLSLYEKVLHYHQNGRQFFRKLPLHPEIMLKHHLNENGLTVQKMEIDNVIFRSECKFAIG
jgi:hypothetical protein